MSNINSVCKNQFVVNSHDIWSITSEDFIRSGHLIHFPGKLVSGVVYIL